MSLALPSRSRRRWMSRRRPRQAPSLGVPGLSPFITPNDEFYRVDTALLVPAVRAEDWTLRIHGMVDREITLDFDAARRSRR